MSVIKNNKWTEYKIGDICIVGDGAHAKIKRQDKGIKYLTSKNFKDGKLDLSKVDFISPQDYEKYFKADSKALTKPQPQDVLFSIIGTIGEPYLFQKGDLFGLSSSVSIIRPNASEIFPKYLYYWIKGHIFQNALYAIKGGVAQSYVSLEMIKSLPLNYPPLPTQRAIASILSNYDDLIENNNRRIKILEEMAKTVYQEWFVKYRFPNHENVKMVESELGLIPEGWEVKELGDIATDIRRSVNPAMIDPKTPYFGLEHLPRKSIALNQWGNAEDIKSSKLIFKQGEILFGKIRPYFHKVGVAPVNGICSSDIIVIYPKSKDYFALTMCCVSGDDFIAHATQTSQGTKMPRANWDVLIKYPILVPTMDILSEFNIFVDNLLKQIHNLTFKNINLRKTRDLLLPKLISGEIDVENLDINTERLAS